MSLESYLADCAARYSAEERMVGVSLHSPGYHTTTPDGTWVHPPRESLDYALALLQAGQDVARAAEILERVAGLQDQDPVSKTYGIWSWHLEEPLERMSPPDWNWADFCGARIAQVLAHHTADLPAELLTALGTALGHAGWSIFRRNVGPDYTNIAIMGACVTAAAGELVEEPRLLAYGRRRLERFVEHTAWHGGFNEYNSPTYTIVALEEAARVLHLVRDPAVRAAAESVARTAWETIAEHFHAGTGQWAGPHSRAYGDRISSGLAAFLTEQTGVPVAPHPTVGPADNAVSLVPPVPCPADLRERFARLPEPEVTLRRRFIRREPDTASTWGTTWLCDDACLGSSNADMFWTQRRPVLGYWRTDADPAVVLRLRFLHDGRDFCSATLRTVQQGPRALSAIGLMAGGGDFHPGLDKPRDGVFTAESFAVRYELRGAGVTARELSPGRFELAAGGRRAVVHVGDAAFDGRPVPFRVVELEDGVAVEGLCYEGSRARFNPATMEPTRIVLGLELLAAGEAPADAAPRVGEGGAVTWEATGLTLTS